MTHPIHRCPRSTRTTWRTASLASLVTLLVAGSLGGCAAVMIGGAAVSGGLMLTDRRTSGTQIEDEAIELKSGGRIREAIGDRGHVNVTSYNRLVLITGEVPAEADRDAVEKSVAKIENVISVTNELAVAGNSSIGSRSNDALLTSKVKATFVDAKDLQVNSLKVVTERGIVYLMGRVTEREAGRAAELVRSISGVQKVVRVFEILSEADLAKLQSR